MNQNPISLSRLKDEASAMSEAGYFVDSLARFISHIAAHDPCLCEEALDCYAVGGLMAGLRVVGSDLMVRAEKLTKLVDETETSPTKVS